MTHEALQQSYREVQELQKHRDILQKQLGDIAAKIDSGMIPDPEDLELPALQSEGVLPFLITQLTCVRQCCEVYQDMQRDECQATAKKGLHVAFSEAQAGREGIQTRDS